VAAREPTHAPLSGPMISKATPIFALDDDPALVEALIVGNLGAKAVFFDRYAHHVERILVRILGPDREIADLLHEVFTRSLASVERLEDPNRLRSWLTGIAVLTARECIRRRSRGRWLRFSASEDLPDVEAVVADEEVREALRVTYRVLGRLTADERIVFALRFVEGLELADVAAACRVSLNTARRRLARAQRRFVSLAGREPALRSWLEGGTRWKRG
jgi:RNA polymerase sigma-70 factor, ECF subfamily